MMTDEKIKNSSELEFAVFCIENVAASSNAVGKTVLSLLHFEGSETL